VQHCERARVDELTRAREMMMLQQRDDEAKNSSCLLVLSLLCESESESALSFGHLVLLLLPILPHPPSNDLDLQSNALQSSFWRAQYARESSIRERET